MKRTPGTSTRSALEVDSYGVLISSGLCGCVSRKRQRGMTAGSRGTPRQVGGLFHAPKWKVTMLPPPPFLSEMFRTIIDLTDGKISKLAKRR